MSTLHTKIKNIDELTDMLKKEGQPLCFTANYIPEKEEYELWVGNQPHYNYEKLIELGENDVKRVRNQYNTYKQEKENELDRMHRAIQLALITLENNNLMNEDYHLIHSILDGEK